VPEPKVFITYRREETAAYAGRLYDAMVSRFGEGNVFMDVDMAPGVDFVERITEAVAASHVLIVVMGPTWATVRDMHGKARIADPEDFVRLEVETALRHPHVTPIPVLVSGASMPKRQDLPPELQAITRRNALELSDQRWRYDVGRLINTLDELLAGVAVVSGPSPPEREVPHAEAAVDGAQLSARAAQPTADGPTHARTTQSALSIGTRLLRGRLPVAIAIALAVIAAVVIAVVLISDRGGSPDRAGDGSSDQSGSDVSGFVLAPTADLGDLIFDPNLSGEFSPDIEGQAVGSDAAYRNVFSAPSDGGKPYWYAESIAAAFKDKNAAQVALAQLKGVFQDPKTLEAQEIKGTPADSLGDEGFGWFATGIQRPSSFEGFWEGSAYVYGWRTGELLQVFELDLSGPGVSEDNARSFAEEMASLSVAVSDGTTTTTESGTLKVVRITAQSDPASGTVSCPPTVTFYGTIDAQGSGKVTYRWHRSDGIDEDRSIQFDRAGQQAVQTTWRAKVTDGKATGSMWLSIVSPVDAKTPGPYATAFDLTCVGP
jgi:hypothetical protein